MKAVVRTEYGSPDILKLKEVDIPVPLPNQVLVRVQTASVNPLDWHILRGQPFLVRLMGVGILKPKHQILGADVAGKVEAVGSDVTQFKPGDEVFGSALGGFAEYACIREKALALRSAAVTFEQAAAIPIAGVTALQALRDIGKLQPGQHVLVNGASGGVGTFAVQIARALGAEVTGVCSTRNLDMVRSIGADHVIDYTQEDFTANKKQYDVIIDNVANHSVSEYKRALSPKGICVTVGFSTMMHMVTVTLLALWESGVGSKKITGMLAVLNGKDLVFISELIENGKLVPVIDRRFKLSEVPDAIRYLEDGHAQGKVIISVRS